VKQAASLAPIEVDAEPDPSVHVFGLLGCASEDVETTKVRGLGD
jgi:hypothetical protein